MPCRVKWVKDEGDVADVTGFLFGCGYGFLFSVPGCFEGK
jgi:hypothetical protein